MALRRCRPPSVVEGTTNVVVAATSIEPYTFISASQLITVTNIPESKARGYYSKPEAVVGYMATRFIQAHEWISVDDAVPAEQFRFARDMKYEIVSFPALFSEMVGGQVRPGHRINVYGYRRGRGQEDPGEMELVASNVWVVDVRTATGENAKPQPATTRTPTGGAPGIFEVGGIGFGAQPASIVTVAAEPWVVQNIIAKLGSKNYSAWVTLAPGIQYIVIPTPLLPAPTPAATATPVPIATATAMPSPTTPGPTPSLPPTPSLVKLDFHMSKSADGPAAECFVNRTKTVYVVVELTYSQPTGPTTIYIDVRQGDKVIFPKTPFVHPESGKKSSHKLTLEDGFPADATFTTTVYAGGSAISKTWCTNATGELPCTGGESRLPGTGGDSSASAGN